MNDQVLYKLLAKYFAGGCSESEQDQIEKWKKDNPGNERVFLEFAKIWNNSDTSSGFNPSVSDAIKQVNQKIDRAEKAIQIPGKKRNISYLLVRVAAVLLVLLTVWYGHNNNKKISEVQTDTVFREIELPDGTKVTLNRESNLTFPRKFKKKYRQVKLVGEAYFEVFKDPQKPFIIKAQHTVTTVLGTAFNVRALPGEEEVIVTVAEGKVAFAKEKAKKEESVELIIGERGVLQKKTNSIRKEKNEDLNFMAWKTGKLNFNNTPLEKAAIDLSKFYNTKFLIDDSALEIIPVTIEIPSKTPLEKAIEAIEYITNSKISKTDTGGYIVIKKQGE